MKRGAAPGPAIVDARATADELCRQLVLERGYGVVVRRQGDGPPLFGDELRRVFGSFEARLCTFPELEPLLEVADLVLVRNDGAVLDVALVRLVLDGRPLAAQLPLERLVDLGRWFTTGSASGSRLAVLVHAFEVHARAPDAAWREASRPYRRRELGQPVEVAITALDASTGSPWSNASGLSRLSDAHLLRRAFHERGQTDGQRRRILSRTGFHPAQALLAALLGAGMGIAGTELLLSLLVRTGNLYAGLAILASLVGALTSLKSCRICRRPVEQTLAGGLGAYAAIAGYWWLWRGLRFGVASAAPAVIVAVACLVIAKLAGARQRR